MGNDIEVNVMGLVMDPISKTPVMILKPLNERKIIPIWIGMFEANAITMEMEKISSPRPMTHDLIKTIMSTLDVQVEKVVITDIVENTFYAELYLKNADQLSKIDCRPSDGVAIALKNKAKIFISQQVYENSVMTDFLSNFLQKGEDLEKWFDSLSSEDFGDIEQ